MKDHNYLKKIKDKNIALIGHMGSGKTVLGKLIAKKMKLKHIDSDRLIEQNSKKTINEIFNEKGEYYFRKIEEKTIINLFDKENIVLSLGGGSILSKKTRIFLKEKFITIFLDIEINILIDRLKKSIKRPLLLGENIEDKLKKIDIIRREYYLSADIVLNNQETTQESLKEFLEKYNGLNEKNYQN